MIATSLISVPKADLLGRASGSWKEDEIEQKLAATPDTLPIDQFSSLGLGVLDLVGSTRKEADIGVALVEQLENVPESRAAARLTLAMLDRFPRYPSSQVKVVRAMLANPTAQRPSEVIGLALQLVDATTNDTRDSAVRGALDLIKVEYFPEDAELKHLTRFQNTTASDQTLELLHRLKRQAESVETVYDLVDGKPRGDIQVETEADWIVIGDVTLDRQGR